MFVIIGIVVVFGAVVSGYLMEHGNIRVLLQPAELIIIGGAGLGTVLVANPLHILKKIAGGIAGAFGSSKFTKARYLDTLKMAYDLLNKARRDGLVALEGDIEEPDKSPILSKYPAFLKDHHVRDFVCDTMRMAVTGGVEPFDVDQMMEVDMEVHHHGGDATDFRVEHDGGLPPRPRDCRGRAGRGHHDGRLGRPARRNRPQGRCSLGRNVSRHSALLWPCGAPRRKHGQIR